MEDDEYFVPLQDQRVFGAGIKRNRVNFIPAAAGSSQPAQNPASSIAPGDRYLSIVLQNHGYSKGDTEEASGDITESSGEVTSLKSLQSALCEICKLPIETNEHPVPSSRPYEASIAHQACLSHSHPPSHLDRTRHGLKYLSSYGWDPDGRLGLGAKGAGIRAPIKGKEKNDTVGLGVKFPDRRGMNSEVSGNKVEKLDAKRVRKQEEVGKLKRKRLQELFYRDDEVEKYLGRAS
ncbi:hypothetical protein MMC24_005627 [Lignoscripta atroalba]|nr:hypothetical protein [Lignoscripta atroalba]